jgi:hypothetical protein
MALNVKLIKDILQTVDEKEDILLPDNLAQYTLLHDYQVEDVLKYVKYCGESGLFGKFDDFITEGYGIDDGLSPKGMEMLSDLQQDTVFRRVVKALPGSIQAIVSIISSLKG